MKISKRRLRLLIREAILRESEDKIEKLKNEFNQIMNLLRDKNLDKGVAEDYFMRAEDIQKEISRLVKQANAKPRETKVMDRVPIDRKKFEDVFDKPQEIVPYDDPSKSQVEIDPDSVASGGGGGFAGRDYYKDKRDEFKKGKMSRRGFLKSLAASTAATYMASKIGSTEQYIPLLAKYADRLTEAQLDILSKIIGKNLYLHFDQGMMVSFYLEKPNKKGYGHPDVDLIIDMDNYHEMIENIVGQKYDFGMGDDPDRKYLDASKTFMKEIIESSSQTSMSEHNIGYLPGNIITKFIDGKQDSDYKLDSDYQRLIDVGKLVFRKPVLSAVEVLNEEIKSWFKDNFVKGSSVDRAIVQELLTGDHLDYWFEFNINDLDYFITDKRINVLWLEPLADYLTDNYSQLLHDTLGHGSVRNVDSYEFNRLVDHIDIEEIPVEEYFDNLFPHNRIIKINNARR